MKNLKKYCDEKNVMRQIFKQTLLDPADKTQHQAIADRLESDLSPENLSCDGELSASQVRKRYKLYSAAAEELKALNPSISMYV